MYRYNDLGCVEKKIRDLKRKNMHSKVRDVAYQFLTENSTGIRVSAGGVFLPLVDEYRKDITTADLTLVRTLDFPFEVPLIWNKKVAFKVFFDFIKHAYLVLKEQGYGVLNEQENTVYMKYIYRKMISLDESLNLKDASLVFKENNMSTLEEQYISPDSKTKTTFLFIAIFNLRKFAYLSPSKLNCSVVKSNIFLALAEQLVEKSEGERRFSACSFRHISDENTRAELEWQKGHLLEYLFGQAKSPLDVFDKEEA